MEDRMSREMEWGSGVGEEGGEGWEREQKLLEGSSLELTGDPK